MQIDRKEAAKTFAFLWEFTLSGKVFAAGIITTVASCPLIWESKSLWKTFFAKTNPRQKGFFFDMQN